MIYCNHCGHISNLDDSAYDEWGFIVCPICSSEAISTFEEQECTTIIHKKTKVKIPNIIVGTADISL